jgi:hypothetical protein
LRENTGSGLALVKMTISDRYFSVNGKQNKKPLNHSKYQQFVKAIVGQSFLEEWVPKKKNLILLTSFTDE